MSESNVVNTPLYLRLFQWMWPTRHRNVYLNRKNRKVIIGLLVLLVFTCIISLSSGAVNIAPTQVLSIIADSFGVQLPWKFSLSQKAVLESIRAPRIVLAVLVGGTLALCGAAMQGLFRNPLADPALIGISSGAALAAVAVIVLESTVLHSFSQLTGRCSLPIAAFIGSLTATWLVYRFATVNGRIGIASLLLAGIAINALAGSLTGLITYVADNQQLRTLTFWSMGSLGGASWPQVIVSTPFFLIPLIAIPFLSHALNALLLGEAEAGHLGFSVSKLKTIVILLVALGVGVAVSSAGIIGFIGLVVPHLLRLIVGPDHRTLLPGAALLGAILLLSADLMARTLVIPAEVPIGIITGILGGPFFLWLLRRQNIIGDW